MADIENKEVFAKNLKFYMEEKGVNQKELAEIIGVSTTAFSTWVTADKYPRIDKIERLANYFKILKSDLIEDKGEHYRKMQKNNSIIVDAVNKMRTDKEFFTIVQYLMLSNEEQLGCVKQTLEVFHKQPIDNIE